MLLFSVSVSFSLRFSVSSNWLLFIPFTGFLDATVFPEYCSSRSQGLCEMASLDKGQSMFGRLIEIGSVHPGWSYYEDHPFLLCHKDHRERQFCALCNKRCDCVFYPGSCSHLTRPAHQDYAKEWDLHDLYPAPAVTTTAPVRGWCQPALQPAQHPAAQPAHQPAQHPAAQPAQHPAAQHPAAQPAAQPAHQPAHQPARQQAHQPAQPALGKGKGNANRWSKGNAKLLGNANDRSKDKGKGNAYDKGKDKGNGPCMFSAAFNEHRINCLYVRADLMTQHVDEIYEAAKNMTQRMDGVESIVAVPSGQLAVGRHYGTFVTTPATTTCCASTSARVRVRE